MQIPVSEKALVRDTGDGSTDTAAEATESMNSIPEQIDAASRQMGHLLDTIDQSVGESMARYRRSETRAYRWLHNLVRPCIRIPMQWYYRLEAQNTNVFRRVRAPYLVIPNHVMTWDPLLVSFYVKDPIHFVASDANFRSSFASWWLRRFGAIAKSKLKDDFGTLRTVMSLLRSGKVVGIFAEGERTWDGTTLPIIPSTAKLVKAARVPVIVPVLKGAYLSLPRWAFKSRRGRIEIEYRLALTADEIAQMDVEEIRVRLEQVMFHDEDSYQAERMMPFISRHAAEPMQLLLFYCPKCQALNSMRSTGRRVYCASCNYSVRFSRQGRFVRDTGQSSGQSPADVVHTTIGEWAREQERYLDQHLSQLVSSNATSADIRPDEPLGAEVFRDEQVRLSTGYRMVRPAVRAVGRLSLHRRGMKFISSQGDVTRYPWAEIRGLNVVYQDQIEFYRERRLIVLEFPEHDTSGYKYLVCGRKLAAKRAI